MITTSRLEVPPGLVLLQSCLTVGSYSGRYVIFQHRQNNLLFLMFFLQSVLYLFCCCDHQLVSNITMYIL